MPVILARRVNASVNGGTVHAYRLPETGPEPAVWTAACGVELAAAEAEHVDQFTGAPCTACLMLAFGWSTHDPAGGSGSSSGSLTRGEMGTYPAYAPVSPTGSYALPLWGERELHWVADRAVRGMLDGYDVVQAVCGHVGWGPFGAYTLPYGWPTCRECREAHRR